MAVTSPTSERALCTALYPPTNPPKPQLSMQANTVFRTRRKGGLSEGNAGSHTFERRIGNGSNRDLGHDIPFPQDKVEGAQVGDFQNDFAGPAGVNGWGGHVD